MINSVEIFLTKNPRVVLRQDGATDVVLKKATLLDLPGAQKRTKRGTAGATVFAHIDLEKKKLSKYIKDNDRNKDKVHLVSDARLERERLSVMSAQGKTALVDAELNRQAARIAEEDAALRLKALFDLFQIDKLEKYT